MTVAVVLASMLTYVLTSNQLHSQVDEQLHNRARTAGRLERFLKPGRKLAKSDSERLGRDLGLGCVSLRQGSKPPASARSPG